MFLTTSRDSEESDNNIKLMSKIIDSGEYDSYSLPDNVICAQLVSVTLEPEGATADLNWSLSWSDSATEGNCTDYVGIYPLSDPLQAVVYCKAEFTDKMLLTAQVGDISSNITLNYIAGANNFSSLSWDDINTICEAKAADSVWNIGDEKNVKIGENISVYFQIIGFNHDDLSDGTGKAAITLQLINCIPSYNYNTYNDKSAFGNSWSTSTLRTEHLQTYLSDFPEDVQKYIKEVNKISTTHDDDSYVTDSDNKTWTIHDNDSLVTTSDKFFVLSYYEIMGTTKVKYNDEVDLVQKEGEQYEYYKQAPIPDGYTELNGDTGTFYSTSDSSFDYYTGHTISTTANVLYNYRASFGDEYYACCWTRSDYYWGTYSNIHCFVAMQNLTYLSSQQEISKNKCYICYAFCI
jgi:hypothetical protein